MEWKDLSREAKNVIEWVENPYNRNKCKITITIGEVFSPISEVKIDITKELYNEVKSFVEQDENIETDITNMSMSFWLK